ncbi:MAG: UDP-glucose 4-epimerase GalE [Bacilli bacterium]|nr:UDP-glucose 4-epimerase GalE [Bacillales bacterium]MDY2574611.1 UDP-glucose 4-epimerase GalE [Bacilli bacterium]
MSKILIVGGAGYIGSINVRLFLDKGYDVVVVDNLNTGHISSVDQRAKFYKLDIRNKEELTKILIEEKIDAVVHFAALSLVGVSMKDPLSYFDNNVYGMICLLQAMQEAKVNKIVFSSSAATYGEQDQMPLNEESTTHPTSVYGETKLMMETIMKWCDECIGIKYVSLRYFNAAGASSDGTLGEDHNPETHLIPLILQVPLGKRDHINVFGNDYPTRDGTCIRDYIHVEDLASAHVKAIEYLLEGNPSNIFNLGSGDGQSVNEMISTSEKVVGKEIKKEYVERRPGDPAILIASNKKAKEVLHWENKKNLEDIISSAYNFHKKNPNGLK